MAHLGGWYWKVKLQHARKQLCSQLVSLDSFAMFRNKTLVEQCWGKVAYEIPNYRLQATLLDHGYQVTYDSGCYYIPIETQSCHFGGLRYYFRCPECKTRMRFLYCDAGKFLCRKCLRLCYETQILRPSRRCLAMANKINSRIHHMGGTLNHKPPWMKRRTFEAHQHLASSQ